MDAAAAPTRRSCMVDCGAADTGGVDRLLFGSAPDLSTGSSPRTTADLEPVARDSRGGRGQRRDAVSPGRHASCPPACRRGWRGSRATARSASTARRSPTDVPPDRQRAARSSTPTSTRIASAAISTAASRRCASICRRCASAPRTCRCWRCGCWRTVRRRRSPARRFTQAALALLGALTWPGNLAELRDAIDRVAAELTSRSSRSNTCCRRCSCMRAAGAVRARPATCERRGSGSSATTSRRCCSITAGAWPRPHRRSASSAPICIGKHGSSAFRSRGCRSRERS